MGKKIIMAVTGASGSIYSKLLAEKLLADHSVEEIAVIYSKYGREVAVYENALIGGADQIPAVGNEKIRFCDNDDMFDAVASGSARYDSMAVVPCSMGTLGRIANGISDSLLTRAADVMLKERRRLIIVPRESPYSTIHLRNMTCLSECGAVIMPASPSFYCRPTDLREACMTVVEKILDQLGTNLPLYKWPG